MTETTVHEHYESAPQGTSDDRRLAMLTASQRFAEAIAAGETEWNAMMVAHRKARDDYAVLLTQEEMGAAMRLAQVVHNTIAVQEHKAAAGAEQLLKLAGQVAADEAPDCDPPARIEPLMTCRCCSTELSASWTYCPGCGLTTRPMWLVHGTLYNEDRSQSWRVTVDVEAFSDAEAQEIAYSLFAPGIALDVAEIEEGDDDE